MGLSLAELVRRFEEPVELGDAWTHPAQLALAAWYLRTYPRAEAEERHRRHLKAYLALCGASQRYHETRTAGWFELISQVLARHGHDAPLDVVIADLVVRYPDGRALHRAAPVLVGGRDQLRGGEARMGRAGSWTGEARRRLHKVLTSKLLALIFFFRYKARATQESPCRTTSGSKS